MPTKQQAVAEQERHNRECGETLTAEVSALLRQWLDADARGERAEMERLTQEHIELNKRRWECEHGLPYSEYEQELEAVRQRSKHDKETA